MNVHGISDFDRVIQQVVKEMEAKHNCWIFILSDEPGWYMSIFYFDGKEMEKEIKLTPIGKSKFSFASEIRKYFRA